jgi:hypothetical protein
MSPKAERLLYRLGERKRLAKPLPENGKYGRVSEARRINLAFVNFADNVQSEFSPHVLTVSKLRGKQVARMIQRAAHDP